MSLYQRYANGAVKSSDSGFKLDSENIGYYLSLCDKLDNEIRTLKSYIDIQTRLDNPSLQDYLYTPEYLNTRMTKLKSQITIDNDLQSYIESKKELDAVNEELKVVFPKVMDKTLGRDPEIQQRMSYLNDRRKQLEDKQVSIISAKYADLRNNLPKIFFMILEGVDMDTVHKCFNTMANVLMNRISAEEGAEGIMKFSEQKYNLPPSIYDPIRKNKVAAATKSPKGKK